MTLDPIFSSLPLQPIPDDLDSLLEVQTWRLDSLGILRLLGELDVFTAPRVRVALDEAATAHHELRLIVDLTQVTFIASAGVGLLVEIRQRVGERGGRLVVVLAPGSRPRRLFELTCMTGHFEIAESLQEAVRALRPVTHGPASRRGTGGTSQAFPLAERLRLEANG
ncbi:STAS domain-containing protein [Streptosporangium sp. NPDC048865]|uniref:STAS domain-containing protein n=1 Tax=Streptosporangium sp. NPDC048865 TaxID=3155766 RepID=UPI003440B328